MPLRGPAAGVGPVTVQLVDADGQSVARAGGPVTLVLTGPDGSALARGAGLDGEVQGETDAQGETATVELSASLVGPDEVGDRGPDDLDFEGYAVIGVATSAFQQTSGGITNAHNEALHARSSDIATFIPVELPAS